MDVRKVREGDKSEIVNLRTKNLSQIIFHNFKKDFLLPSFIRLPNARGFWKNIKIC